MFLSDLLLVLPGLDLLVGPQLLQLGSNLINGSGLLILEPGDKFQVLIQLVRKHILLLIQVPNLILLQRQRIPQIAQLQSLRCAHLPQLVFQQQQLLL